MIPPPATDPKGVAPISATPAVTQGIYEDEDAKSRLTPFKMWYGFYFAAHYTQLFLPLIFNKVMKFSPAIIGSLTASRRFATFLVAPLFAWVCDATLQHRQFLAIAHTLYYSASLTLCFLRSVPSVFVVVLLRDAFVSGCEPTMDNAALATLDDIAEHRGQDPAAARRAGAGSGSSSGYGSLRVWGSVGWGLASFAGGFLVDNVFHNNLLYILYIHALLGAVVVGIIIFSIDLSPSLFRRQNRRKIESTTTEDIGTTTNSSSSSPSSSPSEMGGFPMTSPHASFTAVCALGQGIVLGVLQLTSFIYFSGLGVSTAALGLSVMLSCIAEGTAFRLEKRLTSLAGGPMATMQLSLATSGSMLILFSLIRFAPVASPFFILVSTMNGGSYAMFRMSALAVIDEIAPAGLSSTAQGALQSLSMGVGPAIGSFGAGIAYQIIGVPMLFISVAIIQFILSMLPLFMGLNTSTSGIGGGGGGDDKLETPTANVFCDENTEVKTILSLVEATDGERRPLMHHRATTVNSNDALVRG